MRAHGGQLLGSMFGCWESWSSCRWCLEEMELIEPQRGEDPPTGFCVSKTTCYSPRCLSTAAYSKMTSETPNWAPSKKQMMKLEVAPLAWARRCMSNQDRRRFCQWWWYDEFVHLMTCHDQDEAMIDQRQRRSMMVGEIPWVWSSIGSN